jgi:outer membrane receptor for monomeric catechols
VESLYSHHHGVNYVAKVYANIANTKYAPGYSRFDAMASYEVNKHIALQLNVQTLATNCTTTRSRRRTMPVWAPAAVLR